MIDMNRLELEMREDPATGGYIVSAHMLPERKASQIVNPRAQDMKG
jgi:hypothetical protein